MKISIIVPMLNEAEGIVESLEALQNYRSRGHEVIAVDGGSHDKSVALALPLVDKLACTLPSRAIQMNAGANLAKHDVLLFLHADTRLPAAADQIINQALRPLENSWGRFSLRLSSQRLIFRLIETTINWRTFISGIPTGDQGIFIQRDLFEKVACFDAIPLMEDVALGKKLLKYARPSCLSERVVSSSRRWEEKGLVKTILLMWRLRVAYFFGAKPSQLADKYYYTRDLS